MNSARIMPLKGMLGPQTVLIKSNVISLRRKRGGRAVQRGVEVNRHGGIAKERSLTLTSSCLLGMVNTSHKNTQLSISFITIVTSLVE